MTRGPVRVLLVEREGGGFGERKIQRLDVDVDVGVGWSYLRASGSRCPPACWEPGSGQKGVGVHPREAVKAVGVSDRATA